jgi:DNA-binding NtrC family response regulator
MASILIVDDEHGVRTLCADVLARAGHAITTAASAEQALPLVEKQAFELVLADVNLPGASGIDLLRQIRASRPDATVILITGYPSIANAVEGMKEGARDYVAKPFTPEELRLVVARALEEKELRRENQRLRRELAFGGIVGASPKMQELLASVEKVARAASTVLVTGESGTGKELVARALHFQGPRAARPFVAVNCGALVGNLLESELFGHVRGAFTGAERPKQGLFVAADHGTLFLDEIGELQPPLQPKLLRALQEGEIKPVGGLETVKVDVRLIAATNRDLARDVAEGRFREDLFYRLNVIILAVPPLRERREDIPVLAEHFAARAAEKAGRPRPAISDDAHAALASERWPGNVRELKNAVERAVVLAAGDTLGPTDFLPRGPTPAPELPADDYPFGRMSLEDIERMHIERVLAASGGQKARAAAILGINRTTLWKKLRQYGVE